MRLLVVSLAISLSAITQVAAGACLGTNSQSGKRQSVQEVYRTGVNHPRRFFAEATHDRATGRPQIIYYRRYSSAPAYFKSFVRAHECCHHAGHRDEISANCCALRRSHLSRSSLAALKTYIVSRDVNSETAMDYHGQGSVFWSKTASRCLSSAER
ncbi:MAG: hypothetical protein WBB88_00225 [Methyloceanibacter sp.]